MQLKQENFPLTVKDHLVSNEEFTLDFDAEKEIEGEKNKNIFELIEKGALITKGELFKYFNQLIG